MNMAGPVGGGMLAAIVLGLLGIGLYAGVQGSARFLSVVSVALMVALACLVAGGAVGFLFGIPRADRTDPLQGEDRSSMRFRANTNLEDISDWLTKILVGIGLIQIGQLSEPLGRLATSLAADLGGDDPNPSFALTLLLYFTLVGFLAGYLMTRLYLPRAFSMAELIDRVTRVAQSKAEDTVAQRMSEQAERDAKAISLIDHQLNPPPEMPDVSQEELRTAVIDASPSVKTQAFIRARAQRHANWRSNKPLMERTIPIFRALIASDGQRRFHKNHGQLGYALKDQREPAWSEAEAELSEAIAIRGERLGSDLYEGNRAICRINLDRALAEGRRSAPETKDAILADLRVAMGRPAARRALTDEAAFPEVRRWAALNDVNLDELTPSP